MISTLSNVASGSIQHMWRLVTMCVHMFCATNTQTEGKMGSQTHVMQKLRSQPLPEWHAIVMCWRMQQWHDLDFSPNSCMTAC